MKKIAYIDLANLHQGIKELNWDLDYLFFRTWLRDKYKIDIAYIFIGYIPKNRNLYLYLENIGYKLVFKEITHDGNGKIKGNCDTDLVLKAVSDTYEKKLDRAVIVSGDGDFTCLVKFLLEREKLDTILAPYYKKCSILLKRINTKLTFLNEFRSKLERHEKAPDKNEIL